MDFKTLELWFVTGSQHLYGPETLNQVAEHSLTIARSLSESHQIPVKTVFKPVLTTPEAISELCLEANTSRNCIGLIAWMHTFSPAKMWIAGLRVAAKAIPAPPHPVQLRTALGHHRHGLHEPEPVRARRPRVRLHRQPNEAARARWSSATGRTPEVLASSAPGPGRPAAGMSSQHLKVARFGDNMRHVAVTEGDKVEAADAAGLHRQRLRRGRSVGVRRTRHRQRSRRTGVGVRRDATRSAATLREGGERGAPASTPRGSNSVCGAFLIDGGFKAFTDTFEDLHGLRATAWHRRAAPDG